MPLFFLNIMLNDVQNLVKFVFLESGLKRLLSVGIQANAILMSNIYSTRNIWHLLCHLGFSSTGKVVVLTKYSHSRSTYFHLLIMTMFCKFFTHVLGKHYGVTFVTASVCAGPFIMSTKTYTIKQTSLPRRRFLTFDLWTLKAHFNN